jgi:hypothetical protein
VLLRASFIFLAAMALRRVEPVLSINADALDANLDQARIGIDIGPA